MAKRGPEHMGVLLIHCQDALRLLQNDLAAFLGVSDRTMRRWQSGGTRLPPSMLTTLLEAVHPKNPSLAARIAALHDVTLDELALGLSPEQTVAAQIVRAAAKAAGVRPLGMRPAVAAAFERARAEGLTIEAACALFASAPKKRT